MNLHFRELTRVIQDKQLLNAVSRSCMAQGRRCDDDKVVKSMW